MPTPDFDDITYSATGNFCYDCDSGERLYEVICYEVVHYQHLGPIQRVHSVEWLPIEAICPCLIFGGSDFDAF